MAKLYLGDTPQEKKKNIARAIGFVLALVIAVTAFTSAVMSISKKEPGFYRLEATRDEKDPYYFQDVAVTAYFDGSTNEIKQAIRTADTIYAESLMWAYKLLDAKTEYEGFVNLASINASVSGWQEGFSTEPPYSSLAVPVLRSPEFTLAPELYDAVMDAYQKTLKRSGYSLFAGALYDAWKSILILQDPEDVDPVNSAFQAERIEKLAADPAADPVRIEVVSASKHVLRFTVTKEYIDLLKHYECDINIIDLNMLKESYMLQIVKDRLVSAGFEDLVFEGPHGLAGFCGRAVGSESCFSRVPLSEDDLYYYSIKDKSGKMLDRSMYIDIYTGDIPMIAKSTRITMEKFDLVEPVWLDLQLAAAKSAQELKALADELGKLPGVDVEYELY